MKTKVAVLTAGVLCVILIVFDTFIYLTLYSHLFSVEKSTLSVEAQSIAQYYVNNNGENQGSDQSGSGPSDYVWLRQYAKNGQTIVLLDKQGGELSKYGRGTAAPLIQYFQSVRNPAKETIQTLKQSQIYVTMPMVDPDGNDTLGYVLLLSDIPNVKEYMDTLLVLLIAGSIGAVLMASLGGYLISAIAVHPINQMIRLVQRIQVNHLSERVKVPRGRDEIARLAFTFNGMLNRMERSFEQQTRFVADASHEIRTPLTTIKGYANLLARWGKQNPTILDKGIRVIQKESTRMHHLADDLLTLASLEVSAKDLPKQAAVNVIISEIVESMALLHEHVEIRKEMQGNGDGCAAIAPAHLKQILMNLMDNAIKYSSPAGKITVTTSFEQGSVIIRVSDNGRGIPADDLPHIFDRFYRVDKSRVRREGGTGLGLSIVKELVDIYGGHIRFDSQKGVGTTAIVTLLSATR